MKRMTKIMAAGLLLGAVLLLNGCGCWGHGPYGYHRYGYAPPAGPAATPPAGYGYGHGPGCPYGY
ncbi:MAG: hypothetical protein M0017_07155 [Desulfobacteraceae bacterium]|nr:hypothetical protein [Desulfobacteraceae bacterium]